LSATEAASAEPVRAAASAPHFLVHNEGDHVAVAVQDVEPGRVRAVYMDSDREVELEATETIPLGHKIAITGLAEGADVVEYGVRIGLTRAPIASGSLVHTHNVRSARWQQSR
jgi:(2R)-sulfolactate sulfo-lyase subunit alpha